MSNFTGTIRSTPPAGSGNVFNITIPTAGTEDSFTFPENTRSFTIKARGQSRVQFAFVSGDTNITFATIPRGAIYPVSDVTASGTIYFQADQNNEVIEIVTWS